MTIMTQTQLAKKLGISRSTVCAALNPKSKVKLSEATRAHILSEAQRLNYRPHRYAQIMRAGRSGLIGVFHFGGLYQVAAERAWHASTAIEKAGYRVLINDASWSTGGVKAGCEAMLDARVEGVIVSGVSDPSDTMKLKMLQTANIPMVTLSGNKFYNTPHVRANARDAFFQLTTHMLKMGRRKLVLLFSRAKHPGKQLAPWSGVERLVGFKTALKNRSAALVEQFSEASPIAEGRIVSDPGDLDPFDPFRCGYDAMRKLLATPPFPDAVICTNDNWAIGALSACRDAGLQVPVDLAITGFDNTSAGMYLEVPLTTIAQPSQAMAEKAVEILLQMIQTGKIPRSPGPIRFPCELIIRKSSGA